MGQILSADNIPTLVKASTTSVTLAATHLGQSTRLTLGGQQYSASALTLNVGVSGFGGVDSGSLLAAKLYYVYAVISGGVVGLVASQIGPSTGPTGFTSTYKLVGAFYTPDTAIVGATVSISGEASSDWIPFTPSVFGLGAGYTLDFKFRRQGINVEIWGRISHLNTPSSTVQVKFDTISVDHDDARNGANHAPTFSDLFNVGEADFLDVSIPTFFEGICIYRRSTNVFFSRGEGDASDWGVSVPVVIGTNDVHVMRMKFPVVGWKVTLLE